MYIENYNLYILKKCERYKLLKNIFAILTILDFVVLIIGIVLATKGVLFGDAFVVAVLISFIIFPSLSKSFNVLMLKTAKKFEKCPFCGDETSIASGTDVLTNPETGEPVQPFLCEKCDHTWSKPIENRNIDNSK